MSSDNSVLLTNNFRILYEDIKEGLGILLHEAREVYPSLNNSIKSLKEVIEEEFGTDGSSNVAGLLAQISILAYLQKFNNDKNFDKLKESFTSKEFTDFGEEIVSVKKFANIEIDFKFGFTGLVELIQCGVEMLESSEVGHSTVEGKLTANLLSNIREISAKEYISKGFIEKDLALITLLSESPEEEYNSDIVDFIKSNHDLNTIYSTARDAVLGVYKYAFQDSFGLRPYVGVLSFHGNSIYTIGNDYHLSTIPKANSVFKKVSSELIDEYPIEQSDLRQFDFDTIVKSNRPVYFPKKILEYALGRKLTYELSLNLYRPVEEAKSWEQYEKIYVFEQVDKECLHSVYKSLEKNLGYKFESKEFKDSWNSDSNAVKSRLGNMNLHDLVKVDMQKVIRSMCTGVVINAYNSLNDSVNSIKLRVVDVNKNLSLNITNKLFGSFSSNDSIVFYDGMNLTEGRTLSDGNTPLPYNVIEFGHDFNEKLSEAEPLFGYTAVNLFKQRGIPIAWNRILLGEDIKGTPIFADLEDKDGIPLQSNAVHNMIAGSRSGKGVMTMNILAVGLGSEKPIFYIDRKPDMSVMFYEMTDGNMFIVNGGQYLSKNDPRSVFSDNGVAIKGWGSYYDSMPDYLKKVFTKRSYVGDFGDYVYFRAMLFCISIVLARAEFSSDANIYNKLGGDNGVIFVFDEFKNWQEVFEQKFFTPNGVFGEHRLEKSMKEQYTKNKYTIEDKIDMINSGDLKPEKERTYRRDIKNLKKSNKNLIKPIDVYGTTVMDKLGSTIKSVSVLLSAGFKDGEAPKTDIFVIGQHIEIDGYDGSLNKSGTYSERDSGKFNSNEDTKGKSLMRGLLDSFFHDWFMGFNEDGDNEKKYMGANVKGSEANRLIYKKRFWGYSNGTSMSTLRNSTPDGTIYFKPYLVLNNSLEDDPSHPEKIVDAVSGETIDNPDYSFVSQCRARVNGAVPNLWETVRKKHIVDGCEVTDDNKWYGYLNQGIGFEGLASDICKTQGKTLDKKSSLRASLDIANYVANQMGYPTYSDLLFDFSPEGLFSSEDVIYAIRNGAEAYRSNLAERLPLFKEYNLFDTDEDDYDNGQPYSDNRFNDEDFFSFGDTSTYNDSYSTGNDFSYSNNESSPLSDTQRTAKDYYSSESYDSEEFTKEMALSIINNAIDNYDKEHQGKPIRGFVLDYEIDSLADVFVSIMNS